MSAVVPIDVIEADPHSGVVRALHCGTRKIELSGGGCEFGDWYGFFSHEKMRGNGVDVLDSRVSVSAAGATGDFRVRLPRGEYRLQFNESLRDGQLHREYTLDGIGEGALGDFVLRTTVPKRGFSTGELDGRRLEHTNANRMHQLPVRSARLFGDDASLEFTLDFVEAPTRLGIYTYLRDEPTGLWVMHHRLLTESVASDEYIFRVRHSIFSSARSPWVKPLRHILWRACERHPWIRPTIQVGGLVRTQPGERWVMRSTLRVSAAANQRGSA